MFLAARNICQAWEYVRGLKGDDERLDEAVEKGKKKFVGFELPGRTLGVVGLGAIGVEVANAALGLACACSAIDPQITVQRAWQLSSGVEQALSLDDLFARSDIITRARAADSMARAASSTRRACELMSSGGVMLNFARAGIVDEAAVLEALDAAASCTLRVRFPDRAAQGSSSASSRCRTWARRPDEAEENCAVMVADTLRDFLENGNIRNSVNFPEAILPRTTGGAASPIANENVPNMVGQISTCARERRTSTSPTCSTSRAASSRTR